jgi:polyisoprenoid-binding protein YceI
MKTKILLILSLALTLVLSSYKPGTTKTYTLNATKTSVAVSGTSTLHDWTCSVKKVDGSGSFTTDESNHVDGITGLTVNFYSSSFASDKTAMDDKTKEALKASSYPKISFVLSQVSSLKLVGTLQQITVSGNLSIAGVTKYISATAYCTILSTGEIYVQGKQSIDMTQYGIDPPTAMLGTLHTGKDISIVYNMFFS